MPSGRRPTSSGLFLITLTTMNIIKGMVSAITREVLDQPTVSELIINASTGTKEKVPMEKPTEPNPIAKLRRLLNQLLMMTVMGIHPAKDPPKIMVV